MRGLSISRAWDEAKAILGRDGRLYVSVALALLVLPAIITGLINPKGMTDPKNPIWITLVSFVASLIALAGQLALVRLALGPSTTVGAAIAHGMRRMPVYLLAAIIVVLGLLIAAIPFAVALAAMGVALTPRGGSVPASPATLLFAAIYLALICFVGVRMLLSAPVASAEETGPIAILTRSWKLTAGHFWKFFGFLALFFVAALVVLIGIGSAVGLVARLLLGPIEPMSVSALVVALIHSLLNAALTTLLTVILARMYVQLAGRNDAETGVPITR